MNDSRMTDQRSPDVVIAGGGLVGLAAALALAQRDFQVTVLEARTPAENVRSSFDDRTLVVGAASRHFWSNLGVWPLVAEDAEAITSVHVSQRGHFGSALFQARELGVTALGHVIEAHRLGLAALRQVRNHGKITYLSPARLDRFELVPEGGVSLTYEHNGHMQSIRAALLLAADGALSPVRQQLGLKTRQHDYRKTAIICNVLTEQPHNGRAFECLSADGPVAMLPFRQGRCGFVWSVPKIQAEQLLAMDDETFCHAAWERFGYRLGRLIKVGRRSSYPLHRIEVPQQVVPGVVLMGNAAHTLSPVSAQGLNLAVRDVAQLVETLCQARAEHRPLGDLSVLEHYQSQRRPDQQRTLKYTDDLMRWFAIDALPVAVGRSLAVLATALSPSLQARLFRHGSGFRGVVPPLLRPPVGEIL